LSSSCLHFISFLILTSSDLLRASFRIWFSFSSFWTIWVRSERRMVSERARGREEEREEEMSSAEMLESGDRVGIGAPGIEKKGKRGKGKREKGKKGKRLELKKILFSTS
jgi:hypothetical protein